MRTTVKGSATSIELTKSDLFNFLKKEFTFIKSKNLKPMFQGKTKKCTGMIYHFEAKNKILSKTKNKFEILLYTESLIGIIIEHIFKKADLLHLISFEINKINWHWKSMTKRNDIVLSFEIKET